MASLGKIRDHTQSTALSEAIMVCVPKPLVPLRDQLRDQLINNSSRPATAKRMTFPMLVAILVAGSRTIANLLGLIGFLDRTSPSAYP